MRSLRLALVLLFMALPLIAFAAQPETKAKTIDELAKMYDVSSCKTCHQKIFEEWEQSLHAKSLIGTPRTLGGMTGFFKSLMTGEYPESGVKNAADFKKEHVWACAKCHLPQLEHATDDVAREIVKAVLDQDQNTLKKVSINCLICHNEKAIIHKWQDGEPKKDTVYGPNKEGAHGDKMYNKVKKSLVMKESSMCGQCHGFGPNFEMPQPTQCATLYGSYLHAYVPNGGIETCQDCHMKKHNTGHKFPAYRDPAIAKSAVTVEIDTQTYQFLPRAGDLIPTAVLTVKLKTNAGHRMPDG